MARKRKNFMFDEDILKCAKRRQKDLHRSSLTNYIEHLIVEDCKTPQTYVVKDIIDGETIYEVKK